MTASSLYDSRSTEVHIYLLLSLTTPLTGRVRSENLSSYPIPIRTVATSDFEHFFLFKSQVTDSLISWRRLFEKCLRNIKMFWYFSERAIAKKHSNRTAFLKLSKIKPPFYTFVCQVPFLPLGENFEAIIIKNFQLYESQILWVNFYWIKNSFRANIDFRRKRIQKLC